MINLSNIKANRPVKYEMSLQTLLNNMDIIYLQHVVNFKEC